MRTPNNSENGNTIMVTIAVVATILALVASAVEYTTHVSRQSQRSRKTALAMEIADGHLEYLFTNWRNIYRYTRMTYDSGGTDYSILPTNYFYTDLFKPGVAPSPFPTAMPWPSPITNMTPSCTPNTIGLPASSNFPTEANYTVTQYRIQAVDPMISLDGNENAQRETTNGSGNFGPMPLNTPPPAAFGPNTWQYSFFYLASVDVTVPAMTGTVTAKVRRVFEKRFDNPWTYAMFYVDDLEFQPTYNLSIDGPVHTNGSLYIGTSNFTTTDRVGYGGDYTNGFSPSDTQHSGTPSAPNFVSNLPPAQEASMLPFGWVLNLSNSDGSTNNDSYHELIERPGSGTDDLSAVRYYNQAGYRVLIDSSNTVTITNSAGTSISTGSGEGKAITDAMTMNKVIWDVRENGYVRITDVDISKINAGISKLPSWNGVIYFSDTSAGTSVTTTFSGNSVSSTKRGIRLKNGATLPTNGLTVVAENPVYIQGDYNTGGDPPSDHGTFTDPDAGGYTRKAAAVVGDAINILSGAWNDANSNSSPITQYKVASSTTVNAALVGGIVPSGTSSGSYSGGGENFVRFLEDWNKNNATFTYYGSMIELFRSVQATGIWSGSGNQYKAPVLHFFYDTNFSNGNTDPPGRLQIAAYLQQQRWYQVY